MTYVSPIQRKVDLYLDLINQGVPQAQALQQVGATLAELSASGLDLTTSADRQATIAAADLQLDNYRRQELLAQRTGQPPPDPPPGFSLPGQTVTADNILQLTPQQLAAAQADPLGLNLAPIAVPVAQSADLSLLRPGTGSTAPSAPIDSTFGTAGAGTLTQAELNSGVIARTFEANANYQAVLANNEQRRAILTDYALSGRTAAEAYQDPRYKALVNEAQQLTGNTLSGSTLQNTQDYQNSPLLQNQFPVTFESGQQSQPAAVDTPTSAVLSSTRGISSPTAVASDDVAVAPIVMTTFESAPVDADPDSFSYATFTGVPVQARLPSLTESQRTTVAFGIDGSPVSDSVDSRVRVVSSAESLPFDPDIDSAPDIPSGAGTVFNGTFSATFDPDSQSWGVWDNQRGLFVTTGFTERRAEREAIEFADGAVVLTREQNVSSTNTAFDGTFSATFDPETQSWGVWDDQRGVLVVTGLTQSQAERDAAEFTGGDFRSSPPIPNTSQTQSAVIQAEGEQQNATLALARQQQSIREQRGQQNQGDWRVKLRLAPGANYLYKSNDPGILWPLIETDGVVFPYTPRIDTSYRAVYDAIDLTHSNYRGYFYRSSYADFVQVGAAFTAQDTFEAEYLLAVITFFKSLTKMFYGQDAQRGSPPPLVYLTGLGEYQFSEHPCVVTQFNYNLPDGVDYIRARIANVNATNLLSKRNPKNAPSNPISSALQRLASLGQGIKPGALNSPPPPPTLGIDNPTYVPTKIDISLQLLPMQSRRQVSQQFSLKNFANGNLIKGGFW
jgi:hypothetical protein